MEYYEKLYKQALENAKRLYEQGTITESLAYIFPELKESEDERIRKRLIDLIYKVYAFTNYITCVEYENIIAWLEKQGDTTSDIRYDGVNAGASLSVVNGKPFDYEHATITQKDFASVGKTATIELSSPIDCGDRIYHVSHKPIEKQGEQKPTWSEEDDYNLQCMIAKVTSDIQKGNVGRNNELIDWLKSLKERVQPQPKQEWSDEDENYLQSAENACEYQYGKNTSTILWLKSLKERMKGKEDKQ